MDNSSPLTSLARGTCKFSALMQQLHDSFTIRDVRVPLDRMEYVTPGDHLGAEKIVAEKRFSAIPASLDGKQFDSVFCTEPLPERRVTVERQITEDDYLPESKRLAEAQDLFQHREWFLTRDDGRVTGLMTYWGFNSRQFRVQLYTALTYFEELSRNALVRHGDGLIDSTGIILSPDTLAKVTKRFIDAGRTLGGNRWVDGMEFHHAAAALKKHARWREHLDGRVGKTLTNTEHEELFAFTSLRDSVMHGRVPFLTHQHFKEGTASMSRLAEMIGHLAEYLK